MLLKNNREIKQQNNKTEYEQFKLNLHGMLYIYLTERK